MNKKIIAPIAALALAFTTLGATGSHATEAECTSQEAHTEIIQHDAVGTPTITVPNPEYVPETTATEFDHWQRYSHKGAWLSNTEAPPFPGNWQANTKSDPHGIGVAGAYYRSKGNNGNGDWFYLEAVTKTVTIPANGTPTVEIPNPDYVEAWTERVEHDAVECALPTDEPADESVPAPHVENVTPVVPTRVDAGA